MNEAEKEYPVQSSSTFLKGVFIGGLIGAAAALLFSPKPGRELREDISDKLSVAGEKTKSVYNTVSDQTAQAAGLISDKTVELAGTVSNKATELAQNVATKASEITTKVKDGVTPTPEQENAKDNIISHVAEASKNIAEDVKDAKDDISKEVGKAADNVKKDAKPLTPDNK
ncbi:YtxH domain-containing protein [Paenibacillus wenxiniae]|uniref:YtxH domain-containing protein n=1 Tax=Paenibacillus wenxiniae TaxID=1636843 RepID=A0ABW4RD22_9BACL